jgi:hypothetical protein
MELYRNAELLCMLGWLHEVLSTLIGADTCTPRVPTVFLALFPCMLQNQNMPCSLEITPGRPSMI